MRASFKDYLQSVSGQASVIFALVLVPLCLSVGAAVDYLGANQARTQLQAALDGAAMAMATATDKTDSEREALGLEFLVSNLEGFDLAKVDARIKISKDAIIVSAAYPYPTSFMGLAGIDAVPIERQSQVMGSRDLNAELVMVLDYSKSMDDDDKYIRMREAASEMIDQLVAGKGDASVKVGLVPFSSMVHTSMPAAYVTQTASGPTWSGCTQDRRHPYNIGVSTPTSDNATKWGYIDPSGQNAAPMNCPAYTKNKINIIPLTEDAGAIKSQLSDMKPIGYTNIPLGVEFGWNLLDPAEPFAEAAAYDDKDTRKFIVILTDGVQTTPGWGPDGKRNVNHAKDNLVKLCTGMKDAGITIFTIAYDVKAADVTKLLKDCAGKNYFEPDKSSAAITAVFKDISLRIRKSTLRLAR